VKKFHSASLLRTSFLTEKIEVGVTAGTCIDDGRKVTGKIIGATGTVS
jgi:hypothetical protein